MATEQDTIMQAITQAAIEAARVALWAMAAARTDNNDKIQSVILKIGIPIMQQPTFNWKAEDKFSKLKNFIQEVYNIFESYYMLQTERIATIKNG